MLILAVSAITLFILFKKTLNENIEIRLDHWADNLIIEIAKNPVGFKSNPEEFLFLTSKNEIISAGVLVQFMDKNGKVLAKSPGLKSNSLPFDIKDTDTINDIEFIDGTRIKTCQSSIMVNKRLLGYVVVGLSTTQMYQNLNKVRNILIAVMFSTMIILGTGINALMNLNVVSNQRLFFSFASHELRTPLAIISGHAEVALRDPTLSESTLKAFKTIQQESVWMSRMVNNLLLIFRSKTGTEPLHMQDCMLGEMLIESSTALKTRFPDVQISLTLSQNSSIYADPDKIRQAINNLLDNAAKYTQGLGKIDIHLEEFPHHLHLEVKDNGPGIPLKLQKKIFDPYYRIAKHESGMGLGLALVKWIIESHKGKIKISSSETTGTAFHITLPKSV